MPKDDPQVAAELHAALEEAVNEAGPAFLAEGDEGSAPDATPGEGEPSKEHPSKVTVEDVTEPTAAPVVEEAVDANPFLKDLLESIPPEAHEAVIAHAEQQESYIHRLQAELAKKPVDSNPAFEEDPAPAEDLTDEQLLAAAGYDPEDFEVQQQAKFLLPSLRRELALEDQLTALVAKQQAIDTQSAWNSQLDALEAEYGKMPGDRVQQLSYAAEHGLSSPKELYFDLSMPIKAEVGNIVQRARQEAAKRAETGGLKPSSSTAGADPVTKEMTLREAVAASAKAAAEDTGKSWGSIFKGRNRDV